MEELVKSWAELMRERFPFATEDGRATLEYVGGEASDGALYATIRLLVWDVDGDSRAIRDVKEQRVRFGRVEHLEYFERYADYLRALSDVFAMIDTAEVETLMPMDCCGAEVLDLKARGYDEFGPALAAKSRLGRWLKD